jgi:hypothetical protein
MIMAMPITTAAAAKTPALKIDYLYIFIVFMQENMRANFNLRKDGIRKDSN